jgi:small subunit ribosomal protein S6
MAAESGRKLSVPAGKLAQPRRAATIQTTEAAARGSSCHGETVTASVQRRQVKRMRHYEMMIILDPSLEERTVQPSLEQFLNVVTTAGGTVDKVDVWGRRRLAYEIDKKAEGIYTVVDLMAEPDTVKELDRQLNLNEAVLRTKIIRPDQR